MIKKAFQILVFLILILTLLTIVKLNNQHYITYSYNNKYKIKYNNKKSNIIGFINIDKLDITEPLYQIDSNNNNVDKHITILKESIFPPNKESIIFIAAHSGTGNIAYFKDLDKIKINNTVNITLYNKSYTYIVKDIWEQPKNGYINISKETNKQLILTTCSPTSKDKQLIVNCIEKEPNY